MQTTDYLDYITSEHNQRAKFLALIAEKVQGHVDNQTVLASFATLFDPALAVGQQLDWVGAWVGITRQGLDDTTFRQLILGRIAINHWNGNVPGIYKILTAVFNGTVEVLIQDNEDMSMFMIFTALFTNLTPTELALVIPFVLAGYFAFRPAGVKMLGYFVPSVPGEPVFGLGSVDTAAVAGLGVGYIVAPLTA